MLNDDALRARWPPPSWRQLHPGEDPRVEEIQFRWFREASAVEKIGAMARLQEMGRRLALVGLRQRHPLAGEAELRWRLASLLLGPEVAEKAYGPCPLDTDPRHE